jgi:hypothetical protein
VTTSEPQYTAPAAAAVSGFLADTRGAGADADADEQLPVFPDEVPPNDSDGEPVGRADVDEEIRRAGGDPDAR